MIFTIDFTVEIAQMEYGQKASGPGELYGRPAACAQEGGRARRHDGGGVDPTHGPPGGRVGAPVTKDRRFLQALLAAWPVA